MRSCKFLAYAGGTTPRASAVRSRVRSASARHRKGASADDSTTARTASAPQELKENPQVMHALFVQSSVRMHTWILLRGHIQPSGFTAICASSLQVDSLFQELDKILPNNFMSQTFVDASAGTISATPASSNLTQAQLEVNEAAASLNGQWFEQLHPHNCCHSCTVHLCAGPCLYEQVRCL